MELIQQEYNNKNDEINKYLNDLSQIIINSKDELEGNCFYYHKTLNLFQNLYSKQLNLFLCGKVAVNNICEIGFNAGHSSMLMLLGKDKTPINFTVFDIGEHAYTVPCLEYIKTQFLHVNFEYIEGDSTITMPNWITDHPHLCGKYEVVHVDGGHGDHCVSNDMKHADLLVKINGILIVDDTQDALINKYVDLYISNGNYREVNILETYGYKHRVIKKIK
jgi:hypothetical protein